MFFFFLFMIFCAGIVVNSSSLISMHINFFTLIIMFSFIVIYFTFLLDGRNKSNFKFLDRHFILQMTIGIMTFFQSFFWMIDSDNSKHAPRVFFLLFVFVFLICVRDYFSNFFAGLFGASTMLFDVEITEILPFDDIEKPSI